MIVINTMISKVDKIFKSVINDLNIRKVTIDGVLEPFNNGIEKGMVLRIFDSYNADIDICIWAYMPRNRASNNEVVVLAGKHSNCLPSCMWRGELKSKTFNDKNFLDLQYKVRNYISDLIISNLEKTHELSIKI